MRRGAGKALPRLYFITRKEVSQESLPDFPRARIDWQGAMTMYRRMAGFRVFLLGLGVGLLLSVFLESWVSRLLFSLAGFALALWLWC